MLNLNSSIQYTVTVAIAFAANVSVAASAQSDSVARAAGFDVNRAMLRDGSRFTPFLVEESQLLRRALDDGLIEDDTPILVVERADRRLALLTSEMMFHHVAQGAIAGEQWMVSF